MAMTDRSPLERAQILASLITSRAAEAEKLGELHPDVLKLLHRENLWGMYIPKHLGGLGLGPLGGLEVLENVSYGCASTGWVLAVAFAAAVSMAYLPETTKLEGPGGRIPVIAGSGRPDGRGQIVEGGHRLTGRWSYGSGTRHADYILVGGIARNGDKPNLTASGMPDIRLFIVPKDQVHLHDEWDVIGLRATASVDYEIRDVFVPDGMSYPITASGDRLGNLFKLGYASLVPIGHAGWALGVGRRLLDELKRFAQTKKIPGGIGTSESFMENFAHHEAEFRAARAFLIEVWTDIEAAIDAGLALTTRQETLIRLSLNHITKICYDIANFAYRAGGGTSLRDGDLQRVMRDMYAGAQHLTSSWVPMRDAGRELAGLAPNAKWMAFNLIG